MTPKYEISVGELRSRGVTKLREPDMFAMWVKTACSNLTSRQLRKLADITEQYGRGYLLFTTRQIPIVPFINIKDVPAVQDELTKVDMMLDRCGPTVRNVNVCYDEKICPHAIADSLTMGEKLDNFFNTPMGHKVKIGIAGCRKDCIVSRALTDISFVAVERGGHVGYDVSIGGRLGVKPFLGAKIAEDVPESQASRLVQNYFDLMNKEGKKDERAADLVARLGVDRLNRELTRNLNDGLAIKPIECRTRLAEKETDKVILRVRATCGEVKADELRKIADVAEKYGKGFVHFVVRGSPEIPVVNVADVDKARQELGQAGLELLENGIDNLQSCFGAYCTENNVDPQSLLREIEKLVKKLDINDLDIKISASGCPNSCGIANLDDIGFYGVVEPKVDTAKCTGCELCVPVCKRKAIRVEGGAAIINAVECRQCGLCITVCPFNAIVEGRRGFTALVGGREGEDTRLGELIAEFLTEDEALRLTESCLKVLKARKASAAAIIDKVGIAGFKKMLAPLEPFDKLRVSGADKPIGGWSG